MEYIIIVLSIICMVEAWIIIEVGRESDRMKKEGNEGIESIIELSMERNKLKDENEELREEIHQLYERIAEDMGYEKPVCTCHYEETCAGFPEHNMSKDEMVREMLRQNEEEMKAEQARLATYVCDQCGKRGGCYCNGMTSSGDVLPF